MYSRTQSCARKCRSLLAFLLLAFYTRHARGTATTAAAAPAAATGTAQIFKRVACARINGSGECVFDKSLLLYGCNGSSCRPGGVGCSYGSPMDHMRMSSKSSLLAPLQLQWMNHRRCSVHAAVRGMLCWLQTTHKVGPTAC